MEKNVSKNSAGNIFPGHIYIRRHFTHRHSRRSVEVLCSNAVNLDYL